MKSNPTDEDLSQHYHQAEAADITLSEHFDLYQGDINLHNRFERFDIIEDEEEAELNLSAKTTHIPTTHVSSPHLQEEPQQGIMIITSNTLKTFFKFNKFVSTFSSLNYLFHLKSIQLVNYVFISLVNYPAVRNIFPNAWRS